MITRGTGEQETPVSLAAAMRDFTRGVTKDGLIVLDGETLMSDDRLIVDDAT